MMAPTHRGTHSRYGTVYGVKKTTLYLPDDLKKALRRFAKENGKTEAEVVRAALRKMLEGAARPRPRVPLTGEGLGDPTFAENVDKHLIGFGET